MNDDPCDLGESIVAVYDLGGSLYAQGPPGVAGDASELGYVHTQVAPSVEWDIAHGLGRNPGNIAVYDSAGDTVRGATVVFIDVNNVKLLFGASFSGDAYLI